MFIKYSPMSKFRLYTHEGRRAQHVLISAHGAWRTGKEGEFYEVPAGLELHFYCPHGSALNVGGAWTFLVPPGVPIYRTAKGPCLVHDYSLTEFPEKVEIQKCLQKAADTAVEPGAHREFLRGLHPDGKKFVPAAVPSSATVGPMDVLTILPGKGAKLSQAVSYLEKEYTNIHCSFCRVDLATDVPGGTFGKYSPATQAGPPRVAETKWSDI
jgi:putative adhesin Stv-like protein